MSYLISHSTLFSHATTFVYIAFVAILGKTIHSLYRTHNMFKQMPPGPRGLPLLGNILRFTSSSPMWIHLTEWAEEFGPIYSLNLAGHPIVVLNTIGVAADLFDRRSHLYNDRPRMIMSGELMSNNMFIPFSPTGDLWQRFRKASQEAFNPRAMQAMYQVQEREAVVLLQNFLHAPERWEENVKRSSASNIISMLYGWAPLQDLDHPIIKKVHGAADDILEASLPGSSLIDIVPALLQVPAFISPWKRRGSRWFEAVTSVFKTMLASTQQPDVLYTTSLASKLQEKSTKSYIFTLTEAAWLTGSLFIAGAETTASSLSTFLLAMLVHPEVMRRAQAEIDEVVGQARLPTLSDQDDLPYVTAMVKEVLRWKTPGPVGMPRKAMQDDWYQGYFIPKAELTGTTIIANVWAMHRDSNLYHDCDVFRPERFMTEDGLLRPALSDTHGQGHVSFGFGRRICVGMYMANQKLFLDIVSLLWAFNIENTSPRLPSTDYVDSGAAAHPQPFKCALVPRGPNTASIIEFAAIAADNRG